MPIKLSYINARGDEAILDDDEGSFAHELIGREGFEFPTLDLIEHDYGNGSTDIVAINIKNREVTCYFWADVMDIPHWEDKFDDVKHVLLQTGQKENEWGKLKIRVDQGRDEQDGERSHYVYLNCVYSKGLDTLVRDNYNRVKFSLTFKATEPYFYDGFSYTVSTKAVEDNYLYMNKAKICDSLEEAREYSGWTSGSTTAYYWQIPGTNPAKYYAYHPTETLYFSDDLYLRSTESQSINDVYIMAERVYPTIVIHGPAENISLVNNTTGRKIEIDSSITLSNSGKITIVTTPFKRSIYRGSTNLIPYLSENSTLDWYLEHGNNEVIFNNTASTPDSYVTYEYTERRASVL